MKNHLRAIALSFGVGFLATGCASLNAAQTANTMGHGGLQIGLEPAVEAFTGSNGLGTAYAPRVDLAVRYGITDSIDIGGKIGTSLVELDGKFQLTDPAKQSFVASLAPSIGGFVIGSDGSSTGAFTIKLPLLLGIGFGGHQLVIGPNIQDILVTASSGGDSGLANEFGVGGSIGVAFRLSDGFRLMPEFGVLVPLTGTASSNGDSTSAGISSAGFLWQAGLTFLFGSYKQPWALAGTEGLPGAPATPEAGAPPPAAYPPPPGS